MKQKEEKQKSFSEKEDKNPDEKFVRWFRELDRNSGKTAGGKGANLAEIYNLKIPVPPGFVVTAQAYDYFIKKAGLKEKIEELLKKIDYENTKNLNEMTEQIRNLIVSAEFPGEMKDEILESYEHLDARDLNISKGSALDILKTSSEPVFVAVRSSATTEDLADASFAGQQETFLNIKGNQELLESIKKCFASLFTARATYYRYKKNFRHEESSLAVIVQRMINATKSGVIFSKDPSFRNDNIIIEAVWGLGEGIVSGKITPDRYIVSKDLEIKDKKMQDKKIAITRDSAGKKKIVKLKEEISKKQVLKEYEINKLSEIALKLEEHYNAPQDIEFAIEDEGIFIVQTRPITTLKKRVESGEKELEGEVILTGLGASPGVGSGKIKIVEDLKDLDMIKQGDILVTKMTNPDMVVAMQKSAAIVTDEGGMTAHAAIVSREMGIPCVVGTQNATTKLKEGEVITVDGSSGKIYKGKIAETAKKEIRPVKTSTRTKIKLIVDLPNFAERASKTLIKEVGLTRIEGIIAESGKHPDYFLKQKKIQDYEETIFRGLKKISEYFEEMWVRTSDIRSDEFSNLEGAPKEKEANPMLGMHGIRYGIKNPEILKAELKALDRISKQDKRIGVLLPQVISAEEVKKVRELLKEIRSEVKLGVMVETPAAVQSIRQLCEEGISFISFGTNDLTQYILAVDRGNEEVQDLYNEMHPAILYQLEYVIRICRKNDVETSICGQAGSRKDMVKFLVEKGIDSISVNADMASEIAEYVSQIEDSLVEGTDEEPRQYRPEEKVPEKEIIGESVLEEIKENVERGEEAIEEIAEDIKERLEQNEEQEFPEIRGAEKLQKEEDEEERKIEEKRKEIEDSNEKVPIDEDAEKQNREDSINEPELNINETNRTEKELKADEEKEPKEENSENNLDIFN